MRSPLAAWLSIGWLTGCGQSSIPHTNPGPALTSASAASSAVTGLELDRAAPSGTIMMALQRIRPWFLTARGGTVLVSIDGSPVADTSVLRFISVTDVCEVRLYRGTSGVGRSGILPNGDVSSGGDLIDVSLRHGPTTLCRRQ